MNSSLPDFLSAPPAAAGTAPLGTTTALAGLMPATVAGSPGAASEPAAFSDLMAASASPTPVAATATVTAQAVAAAPSVVTMAAPSHRFTVIVPPAAKQAFAMAGQGSTSWSAPVPTAGSVPVAGETPFLPAVGEIPVAPAEVPEEVREQAVAFALSLLQSLLPEAVQAPAGGTEDGQQATPTAARPLSPDGATGPTRPANTEDLVVPRAMESIPFTLELPAVAATPTAPGRQEPVVQTSVDVTADGGVKVSLELPAAKADASVGAQPISFEAELVIPGQAVVRVQAAAFAPSEIARPGSGVRPENFAGVDHPAGETGFGGNSGAELNFENAADQMVESRVSPDGIGVAQSETTMSAAPTEEIRTARQPQDSTVLPVRPDFQVAQTPVERITTPAPEPAGPTFAERAVETVTSLAEAQFAVSMQRSGSVQLRLQFGGEDLNVRVAIRDGAVHADFRTDSAPLRAALEQEWQAVKAASPEHLQRFAEPVFGAASVSGEARSSSGQGDQPPSHARSQQPPADADAQSQHQRSAREPAASFFSRRSLVPESFVPEPVAPRAAAFLPTSLRLSALA